MGIRKRKRKTEFKLTPRWILPKYILRGWVVIHSNITRQIGDVRHLSHVKIKCVETKKAIFCRIFGPGSSQSSEFYQEYGENIKTSICLDAYFQQKLGIQYNKIYGPKQSKENGDSTFYISRVGVAGKIRAALTHPEDGIRIGMKIAIVSLGVGFTSLIVGAVSLIISFIYNAC